MKPYVTEEQVRAAKEVNTLAFLLRHQPERFKRVGRTEYAHCGHDSLKVSVNGKWNWHSRGVGGTTAVQYLIKVEGYDFVRAVQIVCADAPFLSSPPVTEEKNSGFALPPRGDNFKAYQYLAGRGVCDEVLAFCFHTGRVYGTNRKTAEREYTNCVFVGFDESGNPVHAGLRGTQGFFRGNVTGSDKRHPFCIPAEKEGVSTLALYESPIDAMSDASLRIRRGEAWRGQHYLSLDGLSMLPIETFLKSHPGVTHLRICTDNDKAGREHAARLEEEYAARGYWVESCIPHGVKDYNELLQKELARERGTER